MKVTDAAVEAAAKAFFEDQCPLDHWNDPMDDAEREEWRKGARKIMQAGLAAMLEPVHQCMSTDEDEIPNGLRDIWMDVSPSDYNNLTNRNDVRGRVTYRPKDAK